MEGSRPVQVAGADGCDHRVLLWGRATLGPSLLLPVPAALGSMCNS